MNITPGSSVGQRLLDNKGQPLEEAELNNAARPAESLTKPAAYPDRGIYAVHRCMRRGGTKVFVWGGDYGCTADR